MPRSPAIRLWLSPKSVRMRRNRGPAKTLVSAMVRPLSAPTDLRRSPYRIINYNPLNIHNNSHRTAIGILLATAPYERVLHFLQYLQYFFASAHRFTRIPDFSAFFDCMFVHRNVNSCHENLDPYRRGLSLGANGDFKRGVATPPRHTRRGGTAATYRKRRRCHDTLEEATPPRQPAIGVSAVKGDWP